MSIRPSGSYPDLLDHEVDRAHFDARFRNDTTGAPAYPPAMLLKVVLFAYSQGIVRSRAIERVCHQHGTCMALCGMTAPHFTTITHVVSTLRDDIAEVFAARRGPFGLVAAGAALGGCRDVRKPRLQGSRGIRACSIVGRTDDTGDPRALRHFFQGSIFDGAEAMRLRQLLSHVVLLLSILPAVACAQRLVDVAPGTRVRIGLADGSAATGRLVGIDSSGVELRRDDFMRGLDTIGLARVQSYRVARMPSPRSGAWIGGIAGAAVGALLVGQADRRDRQDIAPIIPRSVIMAPAAIGAVCGGARLGAWVAGRRWGESRSP